MCSKLMRNVKSVRTVPSLFSLAATRTISSYKPQKTHYETLGLNSSATTKEIRHAFLKLSKQCHPDANRNDPNNHKKFVQINEAYSVLSKPASRRDYDAIIYAYNINATNSRSSAYGYESEPYTHYADYNRYKGSFYDENDWSKKQHKRSETIFYVMTAFFTCATASFLIHYMHNYMPSTKFLKLRKNMRSQEIEQHDFIMTSVHDGMTVYYYAVPNPSDPENFEVLAVKRNQVKDSDMPELQELNSVNHSK